jgi:hypothetical protein
MAAQHFRFRPRYQAVAWLALIVGVGVLGAAAVIHGTPVMWATGGVGAVLGGLYLASPTWRIDVVVDDDALEVTARGARRFRLAWSEIAKVIASPSTKSCFVDGGGAERSLLVPGDGAPAPYDIERRGELYDAIVARVGPDRVVEVDLLERHRT